MNAPLRIVFSILAFALALVGAARSAEDSPDAIVKATVDEVLGILKQNHDRAALRKLAEQKVLPHFDFSEMTRLAVGAAWRRASPEQQRALEDNFRTLLVNTYTNALSQSGPGSNTAVEVKPATLAKSNDAVVRTVIRESGKQPVQIDYRMSRKEGGWKVYDVTVEGVSLVTNYRTSFSEEINRSGVDGLIRALEQRNSSLAKG